VNRTTFQQINTLPWGRPAATNPDAEPDWEALRAHADERARLEAQARQNPAARATLSSQAESESEDDADDEALWAAARRSASQDEATSEFVTEVDTMSLQSEHTPVAHDWAALQAEQAAWDAAQAQQEDAHEPQEAWQDAQAQQQQYVQEPQQAWDDAHAQEQQWAQQAQEAEWARQEQAAAEQAWQHEQWLAQEQAAAEQAWQAQQLQASQAHMQTQLQTHEPAHPWAPTAPAAWAAPSFAQATPAADPFAFEPQGVVASPSLLPTGPTSVSWSDDAEPFAPKRTSSNWLIYVGAAAALAVAAVVGMGVVASQNEQQARLAAAERTRREMEAEEATRKAAEAEHLAQEQAAERARAEAALAAAQAAGTTPSKSTVASLLAAGIHVPTAPIAAKPTGARAKVAPSRFARRGKKAGKRGAAHDDDVHVGGDADARSNDPIFGL
jgi:hypothetical protein